MRAKTMAGWCGGLGALAACTAMGALGCGSDDGPGRPEDTGSAGATTGTGGEAPDGSGQFGHFDPSDGVIQTGAGGAGGAPPNLAHEITVVDPLDQPKAGIDILTHDADGEVHQQTVTGADGTANVEIPDGGSVMVLWTVGTDHHLRSLHDVPGGAAVRVRIRTETSDVPSQPLPTTYKHYLWGAPDGAKKVGLEGGCDSDWLQGYELSVQITNEGCSATPTQDLLFSARDAAGNFLAWQLFPDQPTKPGGVVDFEVGITEEKLHDVKLALDGVPPGAKVVQRRAEVRVGTTTSEVIDAGAPSALPALSVLTLPAIAGARYANNLSAGMGDGKTGASFTYRIEDAAPIDATSADAADYGWISTALPEVDDPVRPVASWSIAAPPPVDACEVRMSSGVPASRVHFVAVMGPAHETSVQVPHLPDSLASYRPTASATSMVEVECNEWGNIGGYADVLGAVTPVIVDGKPEVSLLGVAYENAP